MKIVNKNGKYTKQYLDTMRRYYNKYLQSNTNDIYQCYKNPSILKIMAMRDIRLKSEGTPYIISHNTNYFVVAYCIVEDMDEIFVVDTGRNVYKIPSSYL